MTTALATTKDAAQQHALSVEGLTVDIDTPTGTLRAVDRVSFDVAPGETMALLGESGCGKSMTAGALVGLLQPIASVSAGTAYVDGIDVLAADRKARRKAAGPKISIVFQDALTTLNPVYPVWKQLAEPFIVHEGLSRKVARERAIELMARVGIPDPRGRADAYPHQFSGGLRQRLVIAAAVALRPRVLIADEPTTALDVTVQAQIMNLLADLRTEFRIGVVLITHDLAVVAEQADRVAIMYAGRIVETGPVRAVFDSPAHPYTRGLLDSVPVNVSRTERLRSIGGNPPELRSIPHGCVYQARCPLVQDVCRSTRPELKPTALGITRASACHFSEEVHS